MSDKFIGRAEFSLCHLQRMPPQFQSWFELWHKTRSLSNLSAQKRKATLSDNLGAIQLGFSLEGLGENRAIISSSLPTLRSHARLHHKNGGEAECEKGVGSEDLPLFFRIGGVFFPDDFSNFIKDLRRLLRAFVQGIEISNQKLLIALFVLEKFYRAIPKYDTV